jgi:preprotein translocase subunit SecD
MERAWYWRLGLILVVSAIAAYQLVPSWFYFKLPPDQRNTKAYEDAVPGWAPDHKKHLNLGLDLQGGIHLVMGVDVDRAVKAKVARRADEIADYLKEKGVAVEASAPTPDGYRVALKTADPAKAESTVLEYYGGADGDMFAPAGAPAGTLWLAFKDRAISDFKQKAVEQAEKTIRNRVDKWGVSEPDIKRKANNQIQIQLPGFKDPQKAKELLGRTAQLEFKICDDDSNALDAVKGELPACAADRSGLKLPLPTTGCWATETVELPSGGTKPLVYVAANNREEIDAVIQKTLQPKIAKEQEIAVGEEIVGGPINRQRYYRTYLLKAKTELTGDYISDARATYDNSQGGMGRPIVTFTMSPEGGRLMEKLTTTNMKRRMATVLDDKVETAPYIQGKISTHGQITLGRMDMPDQQLLEEANEIALVLRAGALPAPVRIFEERQVGATLGPELIKKGTTAALVGLLLVGIFMLVYYRASGLIADVALALNGVLVLAIMAAIGSTLTLPGIAGFVLTLGMAVDANVLINERIREELRAGKGPRQAVDQGYDKVFWTIVDSHVTTLVAGIVLMQYGSGPVRGFAVTMIIGLVASMFTSIVVTRVIMDFVMRRRIGRVSV